MKCIVCNNDSARYRCRYCRSAYCSAPCFKEHRDADQAHLPTSCTSIVQRQSKDKEEEEGVKFQAAAAADVFSDTAMRAALQHTTVKSPPQKVKDADTNVSSATMDPQGKEPFTLTEEETDGALYVLKEAHLDAMMNDKSVRGALRSAELQGLLRTIDKSRSRLDALETALAHNVHFAEFCREVMNVIGEVQQVDAKRRRVEL